MERLTERWGENDVWVKNHDYVSAAYRLTDYEDTGMTPESVEALNRQIAADVAPVVYGRWEFLGPNRLIKECMCGTCSVCKVRSKYIVNTMLCPNCGAKMDGGDNDAVD